MPRWLITTLKVVAVTLVGFCLLVVIVGFLWAWSNTATATEKHFREVAEQRHQDSLRAADSTQRPAPASRARLHPHQP